MDGIVIPAWPLAVHLGTAALIAVFFTVFARTSRRPEIRLWLGAWVSETVAMASALALFVLIGASPQAASSWSLRPIMFLFAAAKTLFVLLLVRGMRRALRPKQPLRNLSHLAYFALFWGLLWALLLPRALHVLPVQWLLVAIIAIVGAVSILRQNPGRGSKLLPWAVLVAGLTYLVYVKLTVSAGGFTVAQVWPWSSWLESAVDLALGVLMLMTLERARSDRLDDLYNRLQNSHESLRRLADVDPLTGLANRRKLREILDRSGDASLVALDLDGFKEINEIYGHEVGDTCLTWTARTLRRAFRPSDHVFRLGGDEFLVVAPGCSPEKAADRVRAVSVIVGQGTSVRPPLDLSYGIAQLVASTPADGALREANRLLHERREEKRKTA